MSQEPAALVFDTETTGVDVFNDRVVQLVIGIADAEGNILEHEEYLINPGVEIPEDAGEVHGFTNEYLAEVGLDPEEALTNALTTFRTHHKLPWVAYNLSFDLSILHYEFERHLGLEGWGEKVTANVKLFDPYVVDRAKDKYRKGQRKLMNVATHYGIEFNEEELHNAKADVELTSKVAAAVRKKYGMPTTQEQAQMYKEWAKGFREYLTRQGKEPHNLTDEWPLKQQEEK